MKQHGRTASLVIGLALVSVALGTAAAWAVPPRAGTITFSDTFDDEFLTDACGVDVTTTLNGGNPSVPCLSRPTGRGPGHRLGPRRTPGECWRQPGAVQGRGDRTRPGDPRRYGHLDGRGPAPVRLHRGVEGRPDDRGGHPGAAAHRRHDSRVPAAHVSSQAHVIKAQKMISGTKLPGSHLRRPGGAVCVPRPGPSSIVVRPTVLRWPCSRRCSRTIGAAPVGRSHEPPTSSAFPSAPIGRSRPENARRTGRRLERIEQRLDER